MQFKSHLFMAGLAVLGFVITVAGSPVCIPSGSDNACILTYQTNTGGFTNRNYGVVTIYSPACDLWTRQTLTTNDAIHIEAIGLSFKNPVYFVPIYNPYYGYTTPKWEYANKVYGYKNCDCYPDPEGVGFDCVCTFGCVPYQIDSKLAVEVNETALGGFGE